MTHRVEATSPVITCRLCGHVIEHRPDAGIVHALSHAPVDDPPDPASPTLAGMMGKCEDCRALRRLVGGLCRRCDDARSAASLGQMTTAIAGIATVVRDPRSPAVIREVGEAWKAKMLAELEHPQSSG